MPCSAYPTALRLSPQPRTQAKVEVVIKEAVFVANDSTPQQHQRQQQKPDPSYKDLVSSATIISYDGVSSRMRSRAMRTAAKAVSEFHLVPYEMARYVGERFDDAYGPTWECVVASNAGGERPRVGAWVFYVEQKRQFVHLLVGRWLVMLWRSDECDEGEGECDEGEGEYDEGEEYVEDERWL